MRNLRLFAPPKIKAVSKKYGSSDRFNLLDVGCWGHSASTVKRFFPQSAYSGIDIQPPPDEEIKLMEKFYKIDLTNNDLSSIPEGFDVIIMAHIIEHLPNGLDVISALCPKLKPGGIIYIEYPSVKSLSLPNMSGTLNFCDDETHVRLYDMKEIGNILLSRGFRIIRAGKRRDMVRIMLSPAHFLYRALLYRKRGMAGVFWDLTGFAEYLYAEKR